MRIDERLLVPSKRDGRPEGGVFSFIVRDNDVQDLLHGRYGRAGLCLKVFKKSLDGQDPEALRWGQGVTLGQATRAQNLFARHGLAPRVIDIVSINDRWAAQVTVYIEDDGRTPDREAVHKMHHGYGARAQTHDTNPHNWVGSRQVDFQYYYLPDDDYPARLRSLAYEHAAWGSRSEPYQPIPELEIPGQRDPAHQFAALALDGVDWEGLTVLDIGCNLGALGRYLSDKGVKRYTGVDLPHVADVAFEINNWLGYWNLDFVGARLPGERDRVQLDELGSPYNVVFALSCQQTRPLPWAAVLTTNLFYLEGHVPDKEETYRGQLEELFPTVDYMGMSRDHGPRPLFRCVL